MRVTGIVFTCICLSAFMFISPNSNKELTSEVASDFYYGVGTRYNATVTKSKLASAKTILEIIPERAQWQSAPVKTVELSILNTYFLDLRATSNSLMLSKEQLQVIKSAHYSDDFRIMAYCMDANQHTYDLSYFITVVPETEASYKTGNDDLINFLKESSSKAIEGLEKGKIGPGKISFTIDQSGNITKVKLLSTSGYTNIDELMQSLIERTSGNWSPATNDQGEAVSQKLVFSFGSIGC